MKTDSIFYQIFQSHPETLFEILGLDPQLAEEYEFSSREVKQLAFRMDGLFLPKRIHQPIYFVEVQFQTDPKLYYRLFPEIHLYLGQYMPDRDWRAVVLYPRKSIETRIPIEYEPTAAAHLQIIYLNQLPTEGSLLMSIVRLIVASPKKAEQQAQSLVREKERIPNAILELVMTVMVYKFANKSREEIEAMFGLSELKQTRVYQEAQQEGIQIGEQRGIQQEAQTLTLRLLHRKLGSLSPDLENRILSLSIEQLEELSEALLDFGSLMDLTDWLGSHSIE